MKILIFWGFSGPTPSHEIWESSFLTDLYTDTNFSQLYAPIWTNVNVKSSATNSQWGILKSKAVRNRQIRRFLNCYQTCQKFPPFFPKNSNFPQPCSSCSSNLLKLLHQTVPNWINKYHPNPFQNYNFKKKKRKWHQKLWPFSQFDRSKNDQAIEQSISSIKSQIPQKLNSSSPKTRKRRRKYPKKQNPNK